MKTGANVAGTLLRRNALAYCCQGSGHSGDTAAEAQRGMYSQLRPKAASAFGPPGRGGGHNKRPQRKGPYTRQIGRRATGRVQSMKAG